MSSGIQRGPVDASSSFDDRVCRALEAATDTKGLLLDSGVINDTALIFQKHFSGCTAVVVADANTFEAAGRACFDALSRAGIPCLEPFVFTEADLYAEYRFVDRLTEFLSGNLAIPIAVGSGTINDITKLSAHLTGRQYMAVATAGSMDGYTAFGASITHQGSKQTFSCPAPRAVIADLDIICNAPEGMNASGYADLMAKVTAGADWILADALQVESLDAQAWDMVQTPLRAWLADPVGVRNGDRTAIASLMEGLLMGGFAMQWSKSSRPASGADHQFSHLWDMQHHTHDGVVPSHGFKVGIGTQASAALYEDLLQMSIEDLTQKSDAASWPSAEEERQAIEALFEIDELRDKAVEEMAAKRIEAPELREQIRHLRLVWPQLRQRLRRQLFTRSEISQMLRSAGAPAEPEQIGISRARLRNSFWQAYAIRRRFTVLDVALRCGLMAGSLNRIFGTSGPWPLMGIAKESDLTYYPVWNRHRLNS